MDDSTHETHVTATPSRLTLRVIGAAIVGLIVGAAWFYGAYGGDLAPAAQGNYVPYFGDVITGDALIWQQKVMAMVVFIVPLLLLLGASFISDWRAQRLTRFRRAYSLFALWSFAAPLGIILILWTTQGDPFSDGPRLWLGVAALCFFLYFLIIPPLVLPALVSFCVANVTGLTDAYGNLLGATAWLAFALAYALALIHSFTADRIGLYGTLMIVFMVLGLPFALAMGLWGERLRTLRAASD